MPRERRFAQVDVFTATPLAGNPLAVVVDADGLSDAEMAAFAKKRANTGGNCVSMSVSGKNSS